MHHKCRCDLCRAAWAQSQREYRRRKAYGRVNLVDVAPVKAHVDHLREQGYGVGHIAALSGVDVSTITWIIGFGSGDTRRATKRLRQDNADAILQIKVGDVAPGFGKYLPVPSLGARRRVRALVRVGYTRQEIADEAGLSLQAISKIARTKVKTCGLLTREKIAAAYSRLDHSGPRPSTKEEWVAYDRRKAWAIKRNWLPPERWANIDDPTERPNY